MSGRHKYEFQWGELHAAHSAKLWADDYGPYILAKSPEIDFLVISEGGYLDTYASKAMVKSWENDSKILLDKKQRLRILRSSSNTQRRYWSFIKSLSKTNLKVLSNRRLYILLEKYVTIIRSVANHFVISQPEGLIAIVDKLDLRLKRLKAKHFKEVLIKPTAPDIIFQEQYDLWKISKLRGRGLEKSLHQHALKYAWLFFNSYNWKENLNFLRNRLGEKFDPESKLQELTQLRNRQKVILNGLNDIIAFELSHFLQQLSLDRLALKDCWGGGGFRLLPLWEEISERISVPFKTMLATYVLEDFKQALINGKLLGQDQLKRRLKLFICWKKADKVTLIDDFKTAQRVINFVRPKFITKPATKIQGVSANHGWARGRVRLVKSMDIHHMLKDLKKFHRGDILVTWMTQPNMVPIARLAGAIVADEGGITSHAAVIAREFDVPCIVGTKIATKTLREGQLVEVDGDNGIIKVVS